MVTVTVLKENPECSMTCCLEVFQLVSDAHGEVHDICNQHIMTPAAASLRNVAPEQPCLGEIYQPTDKYDDNEIKGNITGDSKGSDDRVNGGPVSTT
jgi:hypothetical protein